MEIATVLFALQTLSFIAVVALAWKAYSRRSRPAMEAAAMIPFSDDPAPPKREQTAQDSRQDAQQGSGQA